MSPPLTQTAGQMILARDSGDSLIDCLTFEGTDLGPYYFAFNSQELARSAGTFRPMLFQALPPDDTEQVNPTMTVQIENVHRDIGRLVKDYEHVPSMTFETVLGSSPDTVVHGPFEFNVRSSESDELWVTLEAGHDEDPLNQLIPYQRYDPSNSPGMHA